MDPLSQGALGAAATLSLFARNRNFSAAQVGWMGALAAMAPDLDVFIRSSTDSLLAVEYHRNFTHSLAFVPVGAAVALLPWLCSSRVRSHPWLAYWICVIGFFTHAPLDCATTYGTLFFWPFSDHRVSLSWVSVVDPVYTLPLLGLVVAAARKRRSSLAKLGLGLSCAYLLLGGLQKERVKAEQAELIEARGHQATRRAVFTTFMNQVAWRSLYEHEGRIYVDQIRKPYLGEVCFKEGSSLPVPAGLPSNAGPGVRRGYRLVKWFSSGWIAQDDSDPSVLGDVRYSFRTYGTRPFWGVRLSAENDTAEWVNTRAERKMVASEVWKLIFQVPEGSVCTNPPSHVHPQE